MLRRLLVCVLLLPLAGCVIRSSSRHHHHHERGRVHQAEGGGGDLAESEVGFGNEGRRRHGADAPPADDASPKADEPDTDLAADPHTKRAGGPAPEKAPQPVTVTFRAPAADVQPVRPARRPVLGRASRLALVCVRSHQVLGEGARRNADPRAPSMQVERDAGALLKLEELLTSEAAVANVAALPQPTIADVGLDELAVQAHASGYDLVLVDVRAEPGKRTGYLIHARSGSLLARYTVTERGVTTPASTGGAPGLPERLAVVYGQL